MAADALQVGEAAPRDVREGREDREGGKALGEEVRIEAGRWEVEAAEAEARPATLPPLTEEYDERDTTSRGW